MWVAVGQCYSKYWTRNAWAPALQHGQGAFRVSRVGASACYYESICYICNRSSGRDRANMLAHRHVPLERWKEQICLATLYKISIISLLKKKNCSLSPPPWPDKPEILSLKRKKKANRCPAWCGQLVGCHQVYPKVAGLIPV